MPGTIICATCDGHRYITVEAERPSHHKPSDEPYTVRRDCPDCDARGVVDDFTGTVNVTALVAGIVGDDKAAEVLDALASNPADLAAWCQEIGVFRRVPWRLGFQQGQSDGWGHSAPGRWVPMPTELGAVHDTQLFQGPAA